MIGFAAHLVGLWVLHVSHHGVGAKRPVMSPKSGREPSMPLLARPSTKYLGVWLAVFGHVKEMRIFVSVPLRSIVSGYQVPLGER